MIYQADNQKQRVLADFDQALVWSAVQLLSIGLIMIYSASIAIAEAQFGADRTGYYLLRHSAYLAVGLLFEPSGSLIPLQAQALSDLKEFPDSLRECRVKR